MPPSDAGTPPTEPVRPQGPLARVVGWADRAVAAICAVAMGLSAACLLLSLAFIAYAVVMRYVFNRPPVWVDDVVGFMLVAIVMLAAADALRKGEHIGVDLLTSRLKGRALQLTSLWALLSVLVAGGFLAWEGWKSAMFNRMLGVMTNGHVEVPIFWLQLLIPLGAGLLLLATVAALGRLAIGLPPLQVHAMPQAVPPEDPPR